MTLEIEHRVTGAEVAMARCDTCRVRRDTGGMSLLPELHKGYGDEATPLTPAEEDIYIRAGKQHDKQHPDHSVRVLLFHARGDK